MTDNSGAFPPHIRIDESLSPNPCRPALVWAYGLPGCNPTEAAPRYMLELIGRVRAQGESYLSPERKAAVRDMLRHGSYKPAGRAKPSSEYLLAAALEGDAPLGGFPLVNPVADLNNVLSLEYGWPASIFDLDKTGPELLLRRGRSGESYVFNKGGQSIDLTDLLSVCRRGPGGEWEACGNPVKDAMATKIFDDGRAALAVIYAPASEDIDRISECAKRFAQMLKSECGAAESGSCTA